MLGIDKILQNKPLYAFRFITEVLFNLSKTAEDHGREPMDEC